ncbi:MAG: 2-keto-4-pentenoate hydratase [Betaproteobacteria bacterium]
MTTPQQETAAQFLASARRAGRAGPRIAGADRPTDLESALVIQRRIRELLGQEVGGWKCSVPSDARPILAAPIFASTIVRRSPCTVVASGATVKIEPEVAFVLGRDLPQRAHPYSEGEIRDAIAETRLVLELIGSRYADPGAATWAELMADSVQNQGLFVGPAISTRPDSALEAILITVSGPAGTLLTHEGRHGDGHPLRPLYWLANFLAGRGEGLRAGNIVTTGSYAGAIDVPLSQPLNIAFGDLGAIAIELQRAG